MKRKLYSVVLLLVTAIVLNCVYLLPAQAGDDGSGNKPLNFLSSSPANGATSVNRNITRIKLTFDKNVVNDTVWANNVKCVSLRQGTQLVPATVSRVKDTVNMSERRNIYVYPKSKLKRAAKYTIVVNPKLTAKNQNKLGKTVTINFKTKLF
ncbi:MAG: Ig-like domain-containing protein [Syntrophomonas sp.]